MMGRLTRKVGGILLAAFLAFILVNGCMFLYERTTGWIDIESGSTDSIWMPETLIVHNMEGHGVYKTDENGYLNSGELCPYNYIVAVGASHTQGKEIENGFRYTDLLNQYYGKKDGKNKVYNLSQDAYFFPSIVKNFKAIISEFPDSEAIIIELMKTEEKTEDLVNALNQREYHKEANGYSAVQELAVKKKLTITIKECLPLLSVIKKQVETAFEKQDGIEQNDINFQEYSDALKNCLHLIRSQYFGELIIVYHPEVKITDMGMEILNDRTEDKFGELCKEYGITFLNVGDAFMERYKKDYSVPYGFANTAMGTGHLNKTGHRIMADNLYAVLQKMGVE